MHRPTDNAALRALFTLPPIQRSASTALVVPELPAYTTATGDNDLDAMLWLQAVVSTGSKSLIYKAMAAAKEIKTPVKELEKRYATYLRLSGAHPLQIAFGTIGFGDLESKATRAIERADRQHEALSRFGSVEAILSDTPAEKICEKALCRLKPRDIGLYDDKMAAKGFARHNVLVPATVADVLHVRKYWKELYWLRTDSTEGCGDNLAEASAHDWFCLGMLAHIRPRDAAEAQAAFDHVFADDGSDFESSQPILKNLIDSGWAASERSDFNREMQV